MLIAFSGLPATGNSTIARALARKLGAVWLRIDSIEQAIREAGVVQGSIDDAGYRAAYAVAEDNLRLGRTVIGDCVNGWTLTRDAWRDVGTRAGVRIIEVEIICSDPEEHRRRVTSRSAEVPSPKLPDWNSVISRDYHAWNRPCATIDTAGRSVASCLEQIQAAL